MSTTTLSRLRSTRRTPAGFVEEGLPLRFLVLLMGLLAAISPIRAEELERTLIPIATTATIVDGSHGSRWETELWLYNGTEEDLSLRYLDWTCLHISPCGTGARIGPQSTWRASTAHAPLVNHPEFGPSPPGVLIFYPRAVSDRLHFRLRVRDVSREAESAGTEVPVVRETDFLIGPVHLLDVPTDLRFRTHLRLYGPDEQHGSFLVRFFDLESGSLLAEELVALEEHPVPLTGANPYYAEIAGLTERFPAIASTSLVRVAIEPLTPGLRFWAFISITNNETQQVTLVTPQ
jgi:hypothetical protein